MSGEVDFTDAKIGDEVWVYVDEDRCSDYYCVFTLDWFDDRDGEVRLRKQRWKMLSDEPLTLPDPIQPDPEDEEDTPIFGAPVTYVGGIE